MAITDFTYNNQLTDLVKYLSLNGSELTVGSVAYSLTEQINTNDIETVSGRMKRYHRKNSRILSVSYSYIASSSSKTIDGRQGRDFIYNLAISSPRVLINYKDDPTGSVNEFYGFISNYRESIIRREIASQCIYYSLDFELEEQ